MSSTNPPKNRFERNPGLTFLGFFLLLLLLGELLFRLFDYNLFTTTSRYGKYFPAADWSKEVNASGLYPGSPEKVLFRTTGGPVPHIVSGKTPDPALENAYFMGGSTTACTNVPEGSRWPDLVRGFNTYNIAGAGDTPIAYTSLKMLLAAGEKVDVVFMLYGYRDMVNLLLGSEWKWQVKNHSYLLTNAYYIFQKFYINYLLQPLQGFDDQSILPLNYARRLAKNIDEKKILSEPEFREVYGQVERRLWLRETYLEKMAALCKKNGIRLVLLTEPFGYHPQYRPIQEDLRVYGYNEGRYLTHPQSGTLHTLLNRQLVEFGKRHGVDVIDLQQGLLDTGENLALFLYDHQHMTLRGNRQVAAIINAYFDHSGDQ